MFQAASTNLARDEKIRSRYHTLGNLVLDCLANFRLVIVDESAIEVPVTDVNSVADCLVNLARF